MEKRKRPGGVVMLVVLEILSGILYGFAALGSLFTLPTAGVLGAFTPGVAGIMFLITGIVSFLLAFGLWTGKAWAWTWSLIFAIIPLVIQVVPFLLSIAQTSPQSVIVQLIISGIIIFYLTRQSVKAFLGR